MAVGKHGLRNIAAVVAVIVVVAVVLAVFVLPSSPHFGFVSEQQTNSITHNNFTSSTSSTSAVSNSSSGEKKTESREYSSGALLVSISIVEYNSSSYSAKAFVNFTALLSASVSLSLSGVSLHNYTYKGFKIAEGDINASFLGYNFFFASGLDGNYLFLIYGLVSSINSSEISALANAQASAMV